MLSKIKRLNDIKLTNNAPQKFFSVLVAILLWLLIMDYENPEMTKTFYEIPITYTAFEQLAANQLHVETTLDQTVDITVRGRRKDVLSLENTDLTAAVDMSELTSGTIDLAIALSCKSERITIINANKTSLRVVIDDVVTVNKAVRHFTEGELADKYVVLEKKITPSTVAITGPQKTIDTIDKVLMPYSLDNLSSSVTFYDSVVILDKDGQIIKGLDLSEKRFKVDVTVGQIVELPIVYRYKSFETEKLEIVSKLESAKTVKVKGSVEALKRLKKIESQEIKISEKAGDFQFSVQLLMPEGITQLSPQQIDATVVTDFSEQRSYNLSASDIKPINLNQKYNYQLIDDFSKSLTLNGYRGIFQSEDYTAPVVELDFNNTTVGRTKVPYRILMTAGITAAESAELNGEVEVFISERGEE